MVDINERQRGALLRLIAARSWTEAEEEAAAVEASGWPGDYVLTPTGEGGVWVMLPGGLREWLLGADAVDPGGVLWEAGGVAARLGGPGPASRSVVEVWPDPAELRAPPAAYRCP